MKPSAALYVGLLSALAIATPGHAVITSSDMTWDESPDNGGDVVSSSGAFGVGSSNNAIANATSSLMGVAGSTDWTEKWTVNRIYDSASNESYKVDVTTSAAATVTALNGSGADAASTAGLSDAHATPAHDTDGNGELDVWGFWTGHHSVTYNIQAITSAFSPDGSHSAFANADAHVTMSDAY